MKILHSTIKKKFFDMIASGVKKEEYKELKDFWKSRLLEYGWEQDETPYVFPHMVKQYDAIKLYNGWACSEKYPSILVEFKGVSIGNAKPEWSDNWQGNVFIIELGEIVEKNLKKQT